MMRISFLPLALAVAAALSAPALSQFKEDVKRKRATMSECQGHDCFGIDWRLAPLSEVLELPAGLATEAGETPLHFAVRHCASPAVIKTLVENGDNLNTVDPATGLPLLGHAILICGTATVRRMLELGASALAGEPGGGNMLHLALRNDKQQLIPLLLEYVVDLEKTDANDLAPLQLALWKEDSRSAIALLAAGADPNVRGSGGLSMAHLAVYRHDMDLLRTLVAAGADLGLRDDYGRSPLHYAAAGLLNEEIASFFGNSGVPVNLADNSGRAPIHYAASLADAEAIAALLAIKADPNLPDLNGTPPLIHALRGNSDIRAISALLRMGADPNASGGDGMTPIQVAIAIRNDNALEELIAAGSRLRQIDGNGRSLLHFALANANILIADRLLVMGLDPHQQDNEGRSPISIARRLKEAGRLGPKFARLIDDLDRQAAERQAAEEEASKKRLDEEWQRKQEAEQQAIERRRQLAAERKQQQREREANKSVNPRVLANEIKRGESGLARLNARLRNYPEDSPQAKRTQKRIDEAQGRLAKLREKLAAAESRRKQAADARRTGLK